MSLRLVPLSGRHVQGLTALAGDDTITPWTATPTVSPGQCALAFVERAQRLRARGAYAAFAVCDAERLADMGDLIDLHGGPEMAPKPPDARSAPAQPGRSSRYSNGLLVGIAVLARSQEAADRGEIGYWIGRAHRGQGYATAAARQLVSHGFGRMRLAVIFARCPSANRASARVVEKLGFRFIGLEAALGGGLRRIARTEPALEHSMSAGETIRRYEITRDEWLER